MYNEEQQETNLVQMIKHGFPIGRMLHAETKLEKIGIIHNALIFTVEDGPFWYGDISEEDLSELHKVAKLLNRTLQVKELTGNKEFSIFPS